MHEEEKGTKQNNTELSTTQQSDAIFPTLSLLMTLKPGNKVCSIQQLPSQRGPHNWYFYIDVNCEFIYSAKL